MDLSKDLCERQYDVSVGFKRLALAVLDQAIKDSRMEFRLGGETQLKQSESYQFLTNDSPSLQHWCALAGMDSECVS